MRTKFRPFFTEATKGRAIAPASLLTTKVRFKSTYLDLMMLQKSALNQAIQHDFTQYHDAKTTFDAKLHTLYQRAKDKTDQHSYTDAISTLQTIIALTEEIEIGDLTQNQIQLLSNTYAALANILRVGSSDDEVLALHCCNRAMALTPSHKEANAIKKSILTEQAVFPTDRQIDFSDEDTHREFANKA